MEALGLEGLNKMLDGFEDRGAEAVCTFAFCRGPGEEPIIFQGRTAVCGGNEVPFPYMGLYSDEIQGSIVRPRGPTNFGMFILYLSSLLRLNRSILIEGLGWDPIFEYEGKTYAEMEKEAKVRTEKHVVRIIFSLLFFL